MKAWLSGSSAAAPAPAPVANTLLSGSTTPSAAQNPGSSDVFIKLALEQLTNAKEAKKLATLRDACKNATGLLDKHASSNTPMDVATLEKIFQPFQLACQSRQPVLTSIAIDCLGKLFTYNFWGRHDYQQDDTADVMVNNTDEDDDGMGSSKKKKPASTDKRPNSMDDDKEPEGGGGIMGLVIDTICDSFAGGENTDEKVQALLAAVCSADPASAIHGGVLLKGIRTTYNIFLLSKTANTQIIAQATLTQMVQAVFGRVPKDAATIKLMEAKTTEKSTNELDDVTSKDSAGSPDNSTSPLSEPEGSPTKSKSDDDTVSNGSTMKGSDSIDNMVGSDAASVALSGISKSTVRNSQDILQDNGLNNNSINETHIKDAYLVFRALCKLSMKPIPAPEGQAPVLFSPGTPISSQQFVHAVKQYLCLTLSRNSTSVVPQVFDIAMDIFGKVLVGLRTLLKKELSVIFTEIIIPIIEARSQITFHQRLSLLKALYRIFADPSNDGGRILVEMYLNYDCDVEAGAKENIWERFISSLSKVMTTLYSMDPGQAQTLSSVGNMTLTNIGGSTVPAFTTANLTSFTKEQVKELYSSSGDYSELKKRGLEVLVRGVLGPLVQWCHQRMGVAQQVGLASSPSSASKDDRKSEDVEDGKSLGLVSDEDSRRATNKSLRLEDDPTAFETQKHRKQVMIEGVKRFNFKAKKGMQYLLDSGVIPSRTPKDIAKFLLHTEGLNKAMIGEFLGEGDEENIAIMHAFVDEMEFSNLKFVDSLRAFLQCFRLPGEAQKIDRFMLKFAERYVKGNPSSFSSADTAYVLAYSVIMLNTDQHNAQVKKRMTKQDFIKNNRGIDEGKDLNAQFLEEIFDEINKNEIVMKDEQPNKMAGSDKAGAVDPKEAEIANRYKNKRDIAGAAIANETMALKTEAIFNTIMKNKNSKKGTASPVGGSVGNLSSTFYSASHYEHVKYMFQIIWMSVLTGISTPMQETDDIETIWLSLEGFRHAVKISCFFDMDLEKKAFVTTFSKFTYLNTLNDLRAKNLEAIKTLLDIAYQEGNYLGESWKEVVVCISQIEKLQLVGSAGEEQLERVQRISSDQQRNALRKDAGLNRPEGESNSQNMAVAVDRIFSGSVKLSGKAIVDFVRALCQVSWDEIVSSSDKEHPRMNSLQRLIEISYYNMKRIRVEWSNIWAILGEHFNQVGCHSNSVIGFFALDKLRQLSMKFLEIEELPNFKFQKDFMRPFEHVIGNNSDPKIKDMVLVCLQQMIQAKAKSMKSGWKTLFGSFVKAAKEGHENIVLFAFDIVKNIFKNHFENVVHNQAFPDFVACLVEFCKNRRFAKTSLQSIELLRQSITRMTELVKAQPLMNGNPKHRSLEDLKESSAHTPATQSPATVMMGLPHSNLPLPAALVNGVSVKVSPDEDPNLRFWFPILFGLYEIIMTCDLEVRTRALTYLFDTLKSYGSTYSRDFWEVISKGVLFPIFDDLKLSKQEHTKFANREDMSVWLSTTLIQALRQFVDLFSHYFDSLSFLLDGLLDLLTVCMTQENETLARIGSTCLQQFIENNVARIDDEKWGKICAMFVHLFDVTTPHALFLDSNASDPEAKRPQKKDFQQIIVKCVLHLLVIQTLHEVLAAGSNDEVYKALSSAHLFMLIDCLEKSYRFAQRFNADTELRAALQRMGFMKQSPNLLKQETSSVTSYIAILIKMYSDTTEDRRKNREEIAKRLIPLSYDILCHYNSLEPESKRRNVNAWRPVVVTILNALVDFDQDQFQKHMPTVYTQTINLLLQDVTPDIRLVVHSLLMRMGVVFGVIKEHELTTTPLHHQPPLSYAQLKEHIAINEDGDDSGGLGTSTQT